VTCQDVSFRRAKCRIEIGPDPAMDTPRFVATLYLIDVDHQQIRPLMFDTGIRAVFHASGEALALRLALAYLETRFGPFVTSMPGGAEPHELGEPLVIESHQDLRAGSV
jgi:hypothetical protein